MALSKEGMDYDKHKALIREFIDTYYGVDESGSKVKLKYLVLTFLQQ